MRRPLPFLLLIAGLLVASTVFAQPSLTHFRLVLQQAGDTYLASCEEGCSWSALSASLAEGGSLLITNQGVFMGDTQPDEAPTFAFRVRRTATGWTAEPASGTAWQALGWSCDPASCRVTLTEHGVATSS